jgi:hypothetical protein
VQPGEIDGAYVLEVEQHASMAPAAQALDGAAEKVGSLHREVAADPHRACVRIDHLGHRGTAVVTESLSSCHGSTMAAGSR